MVKIPHIRIPSVRVGSIDPTSDIGTAIGGVQPTPITYLTNWKIVGNSEVHGNEIWSCGEYNATDGKYHIFVQPQGGNIADITLTEPLRKDNNVADIIEFPSETEGKALVIRKYNKTSLDNLSWFFGSTSKEGVKRAVTNSLKSIIKIPAATSITPNMICAVYNIITANVSWNASSEGISVSSQGTLAINDDNYAQGDNMQGFLEHINGIELIYELATPITELVDAPQIEKADSYSMVISQGAKAVSWSSFTTESNS